MSNREFSYPPEQSSPEPIPATLSREEFHIHHDMLPTMDGVPSMADPAEEFSSRDGRTVSLGGSGIAGESRLTGSDGSDGADAGESDGSRSSGSASSDSAKSALSSMIIMVLMSVILAVSSAKAGRSGTNSADGAADPGLFGDSTEESMDSVLDSEASDILNEYSGTLTPLESQIVEQITNGLESEISQEESRSEESSEKN